HADVVSNEKGVRALGFVRGRLPASNQLSGHPVAFAFNMRTLARDRDELDHGFRETEFPYAIQQSVNIPGILGMLWLWAQVQDSLSPVAGEELGAFLGERIHIVTHVGVVKRGVPTCDG